MAKKKKVKKSKVVFQNHHILYENKEKRVKPVTRRIRKGVHRIVSLLRRYNFLTDQEVDTIKLEAELKKGYNNGKT